MTEFWTIPRELEGKDVFLVGGGPSINEVPESVWRSMLHRNVIAVNNAYRLVPNALVLYWNDRKWYKWNRDDLGRHTGKYKVTRRNPSTYQGTSIRVLDFRPKSDWSEDPQSVAGVDSGLAALNLAYLMGARRIFLVGFDMQQTGGRNNWHGFHQRDDTTTARYTHTFIPGWQKAARELRRKGSPVVYNCGPVSALDCFERMDLSQAIEATARRYQAVTAMNQALFNQCGRRMIESFHEHWTAPLSVYSEETGRGETVDLLGACPELASFIERHKSNERAHGLVPDDRRPTQIVDGRKYQYRLDAVKFAYKTFAVIHAALTSDSDVLIWMDADTLTHADVDLDELGALLPEDRYLAWLERDRSYPECGFYMLNLRHPGNRLVMEAWRQLYVDDSLFQLQEWHDSYVFQQIIREFEAEGVISTCSLSGRGSATNHPLANGPLSRWFDHLKGRWKTLDRSPRGSSRMAEKAEHWA